MPLALSYATIISSVEHTSHPTRSLQYFLPQSLHCIIPGRKAGLAISCLASRIAWGSSEVVEIPLSSRERWQLILLTVEPLSQQTLCAELWIHRNQLSITSTPWSTESPPLPAPRTNKLQW